MYSLEVRPLISVYVPERLANRRKVPQPNITDRLPWEISIQIVEAIPATYLSSFILACKAFRAVAEPLLYRHINLSNCPRRSAHLFHTIINCPELGRHVVTFQAADWFPYYQPSKLTQILVFIRKDPPQWYTLRSLYQRISKEVSNHFTNVNTLSLHGGTPSDSLRRLPHPRKITKLRFKHPWEISELGSLLDFVPNLTHLTTPLIYNLQPAWVSMGAILPYHVPHLESLTTIADAAIQLVPGRPIRELFILLSLQWAQIPAVPQVFEQLSHGSAHLAVLGVITEALWSGSPTQILDAIASFLPNLEELHLVFYFVSQDDVLKDFVQTVSRPDLSYSLIDHTLQIPRYLESLKNLQVLNWGGSCGSGVDWFRWQDTPLKVYGTVLRNWSQVSPTLWKAVFPNHSNWIRVDSDWECRPSLDGPPRPFGKRDTMRPTERWNGIPTFKKDLKRYWPRNR